MAFFRYVGVQGVDNPESLYHFGVQFELGEVSEILNPLHAEKMRRQPAFQEVEGLDRKRRGRPPKEKPAPLLQKPITELQAGDDDEWNWDHATNEFRAHH